MDEIASTSTSKRIRTANYSLEEKNVLLQLVQKYKIIIENKKTDASSNAEKESIWRKIYAEFNSVAPNNIERDVTSLKKAYLNMKKTVRKEIAEERLSILKTGGGPPELKKKHPKLVEVFFSTNSTYKLCIYSNLSSICSSRSKTVSFL
ncbi:hypothetical protein NQ314_000533 [Rhamnusium bicolor]|uniref:Regulatory protein zeste n=1 Tax=Rhamnusium bicolor TaxID=1586634 RepID=A0AAV8ZXV4_9CUCU|nr:hypothetical protein NQ314_000533 [Rhamnusium bicolor]